MTNYRIAICDQYGEHLYASHIVRTNTFNEAWDLAEQVLEMFDKYCSPHEIGILCRRAD
jgi:hypothetical protein